MLIALTAPTSPSKRACSRATATPEASRRSEPSRTRRLSYPSDPNAFTTDIADSASDAIDAMLPFFARLTRDCTRTRRR